MNSSLNELRCDLLELLGYAKLATENLNELSLLITGRLIDHDSGHILNDLSAQLSNCKTKTDSPHQEIIDRPSTGAAVEILQNESPRIKDKRQVVKSNRVPLFPAPKIVPVAPTATTVVADSSPSPSSILKQRTTTNLSPHRGESIVDDRLSPAVPAAGDSSHKRRASQSFGDMESVKNNHMMNNGASKNQISNDRINSPTLANGTGPNTQKRSSSLETSAAYSRNTKQVIVLENVPRQAQLSKRRKAF